MPSETSRERLAHMMVGREVQLAPTRLESRRAEARLSIRGLEVLGDRGTPAVTDFDLEVRSGEVMGIAGVSGNGQRELAEALAGLRPVASGEVVMNGVETTHRTPKQIRRLGVSYPSLAGVSRFAWSGGVWVRGVSTTSAVWGPVLG